MGRDDGAELDGDLAASDVGDDELDGDDMVDTWLEHAELHREHPDRSTTSSGDESSSSSSVSSSTSSSSSTSQPAGGVGAVVDAPPAPEMPVGVGRQRRQESFMGAIPVHISPPKLISVHLPLSC